MRRFIPIAVAATLALGNAAFTSASSTEPLITDPAGDANTLNGQGTITGAGDNTGAPYNEDGADFTSFTVIPGNIETEFRLGLVAEPTGSYIYRMRTTIDGCSLWFQIETEAGAPTGDIRSLGGCETEGYWEGGISVEWDADASEMVYTMKFSSISPEVKSYVHAGAEADGLNVLISNRTSLVLAALTAPVWDEAFPDDITFKI